MLPLGVAISQMYSSLTHTVGEYFFSKLWLSVPFLNRYYPSGDAFASGSDDATVSN